MKRYEKIVNGVILEVLEEREEKTGKLIIRVRKNATSNVYSTNDVNPPARKGYKRGWKKGNNEFAIERGSKGRYVDPPIPEGYKHVCGEWNNGFVIERCSDGSQFVWIPVGSLDSNGTLDGKHFSEKFGRRNYINDEFSKDKFHEDLNDELFEQLESVKKYGGFYISRYNIYRSPEGKL